MNNPSVVFVMPLPFSLPIVSHLQVFFIRFCSVLGLPRLCSRVIVHTVAVASMHLCIDSTIHWARMFLDSSNRPKTPATAILCPSAQQPSDSDYDHVSTVGKPCCHVSYCCFHLTLLLIACWTSLSSPTFRGWGHHHSF